MVMKSVNGKGSRRRPEDNKSYRDNYDRIFKKNKDKKETIIGALYHPGNDRKNYGV
jgi:hypothetical protein